MTNKGHTKQINNKMTHDQKIKVKENRKLDEVPTAWKKPYHVTTPRLLLFALLKGRMLGSLGVLVPREISLSSFESGRM